MVDWNKHMVEEALKEWASEELQYKRWVDPQSDELSSFIECYENMFDDSGLAQALEKNPQSFDPALYLLFHQLEAALNQVPKHQNHDQKIKSAQMKKVRMIASEILNRIKDDGD